MKNVLLELCKDENVSENDILIMLQEVRFILGKLNKVENAYDNFLNKLLGV